MAPLRTKLSFWEALDFGWVGAVPVNCIVKRGGGLVMGAGLALAVSRKFPLISFGFGSLFLSRGPGVHRLDLSGNDMQTTTFVSFPTKLHFSNPSDISLIVASARELVTLADKEGFERIYLPKVGCGLGGLDWQEVSAVLDETLDDRFYLPH